MPALRTRKGQWLLALLVLKRASPVDRAWLAGTLWPDTTEENAFISLRKSLNDMRHALGVAAYRLHAPTPRTLAFDLSNTYCDLIAFDAALAQPYESGLEQAVDLYRGALLEDCSEEWIVLERAEREQAYLHALETLAVQAMERREPASAIDRLRLCIALDPLRESSQRRLMQALAAENNYSAVTKTYRDLRLYLHREMNTEPDPETTRLYEQLRQEAQNPVRSTTPPTASPIPQETGPSSYVPQPVTELVGRAREIEEVEYSLTRARLITVTGTGGVGKTRLATEVAQRCVGKYRDGVWFVELAALTDPSLVAQTIASLLGIREQAGIGTQETLIRYLRRRNALVVLDNGEHLIQECMRLSGELLNHCPEVSLLVNSRQALGITGEVLWRVPSLALPDLQPLPVEKDLPAQLMEFDAIRLFVKRAALVQPDFRLTSRNAPAVVQICHRLDGIPLAIELAAARLRVLTAEQIAARLEDLFHLLTGGSRTALPRHQTLRSALDWSYDLLTEAEQALLRSLAAFAGGWTLETAEAVCSDANRLEAWEVLDLLTSLLDKSLVIFVSGETGQERYRLLETVRRYGLDRLTELGEAETVRRRHRDYFLALGEGSVERLQGPEQAAWLDRLESEHDNLRAALKFCVEERRKEKSVAAIEMHLRLACAMAEFWEKRSYWSEGNLNLVEALEQSEEATPRLRARALIFAASLRQKQGDHAAAGRQAEQGLALAQELKDQSLISTALQHLGVLAIKEGRYAEAKSFLEESMAISRANSDSRGVAVCLLNLATIAQPEGDYPEARRLMQESLEIFRTLGDKTSIGVILNNLGNLYYWEGDYAQARMYYEESLEIRRELGSRSGAAMLLMHLGNVANELGEYEQARLLMEESLAIRRQVGDVQQIAYTLHNLGLVAFQQGDYASAAALHRESIPLLQRVNDRPALTNVLEAFATLAEVDGDTGKAVRLSAAAVVLRNQLGTPQPPSTRDKHDQTLNDLRRKLGDEAFKGAWQQGSILTPEQALEHALGSP